jgi:hypothetical protein
MAGLLSRITSWTSASVTLSVLLAGTVAIVSCSQTTLGPADGASKDVKSEDLAAGFLSPPDSARPFTWWHWMNGNVSKEGITLDLEAMKRVGIGGFHLFQVGANIPQGPVKFGSSENVELLRFALQEANRLGLEFAMHNCPGWSSSGGPWITPEQSMKVLATSEMIVISDGNKKVEVTLQQPAAQRNFYRDGFVLAFPIPDSNALIPNYRTKAGYPGGRGGRGGAAAPAATGIDPASVRDISKNMDDQGRLNWNAPVGQWTVLRIGYTTTGAQNSPGPTGGEGLECDKFDRTAIEFHFNHYFGDLFDSIKPLADKGRVGALIDSYERGLQNWSVNFPQEFRKRRGYDLKPYLPAMAGRVVGNTDVSERFLWDVRKTQAELMEEYYYGRFAELCHAHGMQAFIEPYDPGNFDEMAAGAYADMPMGEFWQQNPNHHSIKLAASVAHVNGRPVIAAESFTSERNPWGEYPYSLKALGDFMYTQGLNRIILHSYASQPHPTAAPGVTMGRWGGFFGRTNTWYSLSSPWLTYLARCQYLLQQGSYVADLLYFAGEDSPARAPGATALNPAVPQGYAFDTIDANSIIKRLKVKAGRIVLPDGMTYRVFVLPNHPTITVEVLSKIRDLVNDGMWLVVNGPKPESTPSLSGYPNADKEVQRLGGELWGDLDGKTRTERTCGKGRVFWGQPLPAVLGKVGAIPDFQFSSRFNDATINYIHRRVGDADIYFIANRAYRSEDLVCTFRVAGKLPEFWSADTGRMVPASVYESIKGRVRLPVRLDPAGSVFVVFRSPVPTRRLLAIAKDDKPIVTTELQKPAEAGPSISGMPTTLEEPPALNVVADIKGSVLVWQNGTYALRDNADQISTTRISNIGQPVEIGGPWRLTFPPNLGAPPEITLDKLTSWSEHSEDGVKYFSGTGTYAKRISVAADATAGGKRLYLDLGRVMVLAEVLVNGRNMGILWKAPYQVDITDAVHPGDNDLEIRVTNLWPNRLIGDEQLPAENEYGIIGGPPGGGGLGTAAVRKMPDWYVQGQPKPPGGRVTFTTWQHFRKDSPLLESGLIGPVRLRSAVRLTIER